MRLFGQQPVHMPGRRPTRDGEGKLASQANAFLGVLAPYVRALSGHVRGSCFNDDLGSDCHIFLSPYKSFFLLLPLLFVYAQ
jgi:hypothetical protein